MIVKRIFDVAFSFLGIILLLPVFLIFSVWIILDSRGGVFYIQKRVGKNNGDFDLIKFRTMKPDSDKKGLLTVGARDSRITGIGYFLRKFKIDELPQLFNVFLGSMSFVGPRPEVRRYVEMYDEKQIHVLSVKPGITDFASVKFFNENEILAKSPNPEKKYIEEIMPTKLNINLDYVKNRSFFLDIKILMKTFLRIFNL